MKSGRTIAIMFVALSLIAPAGASIEGTVKVSAHFVTYPKTTVDKILSEDITKPLDITVLAELLKQGEGKILASPSFLAASNTESTFADLNDHRLHQDVDIETGQNTRPIMKPQDYEDFGEGLLLKVTPKILNNGEKVYLTFDAKMGGKPELVSHKVGSLPVSSDETLDFTYEQTVVKYFNFKSHITLKNGETVLVAGGTTSSGEEKIYIFLTCSVMGTYELDSKK